MSRKRFKLDPTTINIEPVEETEEIAALRKMMQREKAKQAAVENDITLIVEQAKREQNLEQ